ncbi:MAG: WD40 repeat domain-containing protein [Gemmataceae bacterium]|nr:WD40 repeat domain-containing protein [Gemmataceae bacterium]
MFTLRHRKTMMRSPSFSPDGTKLAASQARGRVVVWDLATREVAADLDTGPYANGSMFHTDRRVVVSTWNNVLFFEKLSTLNVVPKPPAGRFQGVRAATVPPGGKLLFAALGRSVYALPFPKPGDAAWEWAPEDGLSVPSSLALSPDGKTLAVGTTRGAVELLDAATGRPAGRMFCRSTATVAALALSPDAQAAAWCAASRLRIARRGPGAGGIERSLGKTHFIAIAWHPSGAFLATANGDGKADFWDALTGERRESFDWGTGKLLGIAFDAAGDRAAATAENGTVVVWDVDR